MVYLATGHHDMRKSINGLAQVVAATLGLDPVSPHWLVLYNRARARIKIPHWDTNGFWLQCCRLEEGCFHWPEHADDTQALAVTARQLRWLIDGLKWQNALAHPSILA